MKFGLLCTGLVVLAVGCTVFNTPPDPHPPTEIVEPVDAGSQGWDAEPDAKGSPPPDIDAGDIDAGSVTP